MEDLGILTQGEIVTSPEQHRLIAKRAWLQLCEYLEMNDERIKASRVPVPWNLEEDADVERYREHIHNVLSRFSSFEAYEEYVRDSESHYEDINFEEFWTGNLGTRERAMVEQATSFNPKTIFDVGVGYGVMTLQLAKKGYQITGLCPNRIATQRLHEQAHKNNLPAEFVTGVFESLDFKGKQFDVVIAGEILEHVMNDVAFLQKCCDIARRAVVVSTPVGSVECGFVPNSRWREQNEHVRSYSEKSFKRLLQQVDGFQVRGEVKKVSQQLGYRGQKIECFLATLVKEKAHEEVHPPQYSPGTNGELQRAEQHAPQEAGQF